MGAPGQCENWYGKNPASDHTTSTVHEHKTLHTPTHQKQTGSGSLPSQFFTTSPSPPQASRSAGRVGSHSAGVELRAWERQRRIERVVRKLLFQVGGIEPPVFSQIHQ